jgi:GNAT superfamily N-acetyltransferase
MKVKEQMIRPFRDSDVIPLHDMICDTINSSYSGVYPVRALQFFKEYHSGRNIFDRSQAGEILIVEKAGSIVATGALVGNEILAVFVRPDSQGQGYGKTIMSELENRAKEHGFSEVTLSVSLPSRKFYESLEYEIQAECSIDVGEGQHLDYWPGRKILTS